MRANKSKNVYKINPSNYHKILKDKITDTYKIDHNDIISQINDTLKFANKLRIEDRLGKFNMKDAYILLKDHKPNFQKTTHNNLWKNSTDSIEWFRNLKNKSKAIFIQFDIIDF